MEVVPELPMLGACFLYGRDRFSRSTLLLKVETSDVKLYIRVRSPRLKSRARVTPFWLSCFNADDKES